MKSIVIVGGGTGGTIAANVLARKLSSKDAKITLVDSSGKHVYQPGFLYVAFGDLKPEDIVRDERGLLNRKVELIIDDAKVIRPDERKVLTASGRSLEYDYLIVATGVRLCPEEVPGHEGTYHFYDLEPAIKLRNALFEFPGGKIVIGIGGIPYKCPPAPAEAACQLDYFFSKLGGRDKVSIHYLSPFPRVFPLESIAPLAQEIMESKKIEYTLMFNVESVDVSKKTVHSLEGESVKYDLLILIPPHKGAKVVEDSGLGDRVGWIPTDKHTLKMKGYDDVFVIGDATDIPIPKAGVAAHYEAKIVAHNIVEDIKGTGNYKLYDGRVRCFCDAGHKKGITIAFDYERPPKPTRLSRTWYYMKMFVNSLYWRFILQGLV